MIANLTTLLVVWFFLGLFISSWWPTWLPLYVLGIGLLFIPAIILHSDALFESIISRFTEPPSPTPQETPPEIQPASVDIEAIVTEAYDYGLYGQSLKKMLDGHSLAPVVINTVRALAMAEDFSTESPYMIAENRAQGRTGDQFTKRSFFVREMVTFFQDIARRPPEISAKSPLSAPLIDFVEEPHKAVSWIVRSCTQSRGIENVGLFNKWRTPLGENILDNRANFKDPHYPINSDLPPHRLPGYFKKTPFEFLFKYPVPLTYSDDQRFSHMVITGGNKSGKSTLLKRLIQFDLDQENPPSLIIVDSHNDITPWLTNLDLFHPDHGRLKDRLIIFSRSATPAINVFHGHDPENIEDALSVLRYMFTSLKVDLTGHQNLIFTPCARFLVYFPHTMGRDATLDDFTRLLEAPMPPEFKRAATKVPERNNREFMLGAFNDPMYDDRKKELLTRLIGLKNEGYAGLMLTSSQTRVDLYDRLNAGAVILIDAAGMGDTTSMFGRVCIALVLQAIFGRFKIPPQQRKPTFLYVDEAQYYFDNKTLTLLRDARKFLLGGIFAHHGLKDLDDDLRDYLMGETAIRMVGRPLPADLLGLARALHTTQEVLNSQPQYHFTTWIEEVTKRGPVSASVDAALVEGAQTMGEEANAELLRRNRERITAAPREEPPPAEPPKAAPEPNGPDNPSAPGGAGRTFDPENVSKIEPRAQEGSFNTVQEAFELLLKSADEFMAREAAEEAAMISPESTEPPKRRKRPNLKRRGPLIDPDEPDPPNKPNEPDKPDA